MPSESVNKVKLDQEIITLTDN